MAEGIFSSMLKEEGISEVECRSAGLSAAEGDPPSRNAVLACREIGVDISEHRSQRLTSEALPRIDLFVAMTETHGRILRSAGVPEEKLLVLGGGITDPYGGSLSIYRRCRDEIRGALRELLPQIVSRVEETDG